MPVSGVIAASFTPMRLDRAIDYARIPHLVGHFIEQGVAGIYALGSTGEGPLLSFDERRRVADTFVTEAKGQLPVIVHVGHESLSQAHELARHAQTIGASGVSAVSPMYFKPATAETLADCMAVVASGAPDLPFFYYHIPSITGVTVGILDFVRVARQRIPNFAGIKFTSPRLDEMQSCIQLAGDRFQVIHGVDEMLLFGLAAGVTAAIGSTYNFAAPLYKQLIHAFAGGAIHEAQLLQSWSQRMVQVFCRYGALPAQKAIMAMIGIDCGPCRLPLQVLADDQLQGLHNDLQAIGFFDWSDEAKLLSGTKWSEAKTKLAATQKSN